MTNNMTLEDVLKAERQKLEKLETVESVRTSQWNNQLAGAGGFARGQIQVQFDTWKGNSEKEIDETKLRISDLENRIALQIKETRTNARAELDTKKKQALEKWLDEGGIEQTFAEAWPEMEKELLKQRTLGSLNPVDLMESKRNMVSGL